MIDPLFWLQSADSLSTLSDKYRKMASSDGVTQAYAKALLHEADEIEMMAARQRDKAGIVTVRRGRYFR